MKSRRLMALPLFLALLLLAGCTSHSDLVYDGNALSAVTYTREKNASTIELLSSATPESLAGAPLMSADGPYWANAQTLETGALPMLTIRQNNFDEGTMPYDGRRMIANDAMDILDFQAEPVGHIAAGEEFIARHMVGSLIAVLAGERFGFVDARHVTVKDTGEPPTFTPLQNVPEYKAGAEGGVLTLGCQTSFRLSGEKISVIILEEGVTAVAEIEFDFDELHVPAGANVVVARCTGDRVIAAEDAQVVIDESANVAGGIVVAGEEASR